LASYGRKPAQYRLSKWPTIVAAPTLLGLAAAFALSAQSIPESSSSSAISHRAVSAGSSRSVPTALLVSAIHSVAASKPAIARKAASTRLATYTVRSGDTLSSIALKVYRDAAAWPVLYWANRNQVRWANSIQVGEVLTVPTRPGRLPAAPRQLGPTHAPVAQPTIIEQDAAQRVSSVTSAPAHTATTYTGYSSFQACVIARESGGNSQVMNSSGHYGLYQFSSSTWAAYGGNPADFGHASVTEQNRVFDNAIAAGGQFNWAPYDGC
jgi:LysM repeat protein